MKIFKSKIMKITGLLLVAIFALAACSNDNEGGSSDGDAELRFSWWGNDDRHKMTLDAIKSFEEEHEGVTVEGEYSGFDNLDEKITTQLAGGTEADIMTLLYNWITQFSPNGDAFYDLNELSDIIDLSQYDEEFLEFGYSNGVLQAIPHGENTLVVALNKSVFDELGLEVPTTWEGYKEAAKEFPEGSYPLVSPTTRFAVTVYLQQKTGKTEFNDSGEMNYTEEDYKDAMEWYLDLVDAGVFASREDYLENVGTEPESLAQNPKYISGQYAGVLEWSGALESYQATLKDQNQELIIAPFPTIENAKTEGSISKPTMLLGISKNTKNPERAAEFLNYIINEPNGVKEMGLARGVPASSKAVDILIENDQISGISEEAYEFGKDVGKLNETPFYENSKLSQIFQSEMENLELGQSTLEKASERLYTQTKEQAEKLAAE